MDDPQLVRESFKLGVSGYLPKSSGAEVTRHALQLVRSGGVYVPTRRWASQQIKPRRKMKAADKSSRTMPWQH
tara:strand:+ start:5095 stop:5313 length:219 start_codon:yes stop_codon:yes gene_type:complete